ncbi:MAG TPA: V4R domain-containing protein [Gemmatimonadaceae bacterium]|jgi:predicted hydrocarbon binding protein|nr:V4R domain-containing protein [Gemmatimonadaceae bacterium]
MAHSIDLPANAMVGLTRETLVALCASLLRENGPQAAMHLQNAGYAGGATLFDAFTVWLKARGYGAPEAQPASMFGQRATQFFGELGWGSLDLGTVGESVAVVDSSDWAEADASTGLEFPGCYLTTGLFADFFGRLAGSPLAVMEVECRSMGAQRCRFLIASAEVMQHVYDAMGNGLAYDAAVTGAERGV